MANCAIYIKGSNEITYFIKDCIQSGRDYTGSNMKLTGIKEYLFDTKWTEDEATRVYEIAGDESKFVGYDKKVSDLSEALRYDDIVVSSRVDVDTVTKMKIRAKYDIDKEFQIHREKDAKQWKEYYAFVDGLVKVGRAFKEKNFKEV